jgi:hypothetical protein
MSAHSEIYTKREAVTSNRCSSTPGYIHKRYENLGPHKNLYTSVHSIIIYNRPKVETD